MFKKVSPQVDFPTMEKKILNWWYSAGIVDKYLRKNKSINRRFSFLDGPITANNPMGVHHAWGRTYKDLWQRFYNMKGFKQRFQNGFDCQGLWVEVEVEKELGIKNKKEIENLVPGDKNASIKKFVDLCKKRVKKYSRIQTEQSKRLGYFMDWDNSYYTMSDENNYMIWYFLKKCHQNNWIYKGVSSVPWCPRCQTAISQHEILTEDYKEIAHQTVFVKLPILDNDFYLCFWTTTPWTVPANVALAVNPEFKYQIWQDKKGEKIVTVDPREIEDEEKRTFLNELLRGKFKKVKETLPGKKLVDLRYKGPYDQLPRVQKSGKQNPVTFHAVVDAKELVLATKGTGILHVATGAGTEDFRLGLKKNLPTLSVIGDDGRYLEGMGEFSGKNAKEKPELILDDLKKRENGRYLLDIKRITHRYPVCWRCKTELVWKVTDEWYIAMDQKSEKNSKFAKMTLRQKMMKVAKKISWIPEFGLDRELDWLKNMEDWLISKKNRYWGLCLPIWECKKCGYFEVIGSKEELKQKAKEGYEQFVGHSPHKPQIDNVKIQCVKCKSLISRIEPVGNPWLDAGIVPFSSITRNNKDKPLYLTDKKEHQQWFPVDFITESFPGQFKNWFYSLIAMSTVLEEKKPFKTVLGFATLLGEDGRPMHKSLGNSIEFNEGADKIGVDVMRWMFLSQKPSQNLLFGYKQADRVRRKFHLLLWNVYNFFVTYANLDKIKIENLKLKIENLPVLDRWIIARLQQTISLVNACLKDFNAYGACLATESFIDDLSRWYVRRSRDRIGLANDNVKDKNNCYSCLYYVLVTLGKILSPFIPFLSEEIYKNLTTDLSVHLTSWPKEDIYPIVNEDSPLKKMQLVRTICELGHAQRKKKNVKVRQPLGKMKIFLQTKLPLEFERLIKDELNVKTIEWVKEKELRILLDIKLTKKLKEEAEAREIIRKIQLLRKKSGCKLDEKIIVALPSWPKAFESEIRKKTLSTLVCGESLKISRD